jgi:predicted acylesterase/phospholipase RssA
MKKIGLALSGGGFRASLYHLGLVRFLRDAKILPSVTHITSVSGGSIFAAHLVLNWDRYNGSASEFEAAASEVLAFVRLGVRNRITRRFPLAIPLRWLRWLVGGSNRQLTRTGLLEYHYQRHLYGDTSLFELPEKPQLHLLATNVSEGCLCSFNRNGLLMVRRQAGHCFRIDQIHVGLATVAMAVAASSAFPGFFPPLELTGADVGAKSGDFGRQAYTDGGVFDNLGVRMFRCLEPMLTVDAKLDGVLVSDVGKRIAVQTGGAGGVIRTALRATDILMDRVWQLENETFHGTPGFVFAPITEVVEPAEDANALHPEIQRQVANIRTDLDRFSPLEISSLIKHGYCVGRKVCRANPELFGADLPSDAPWDPNAAPHDPAPALAPVTAITSLLHHVQAEIGAGAKGAPAPITVEARTLQTSATRRIWSTLLDHRDWTSYVYVPLIVPILFLLPYFVVTTYQRSHRANQLIHSFAQGSRDLETMTRLLDNGPEAPWAGQTAEEVSKLDEPDYKGFEVLQASIIMDLRRWKPTAAGTIDPNSSALVYRRFKVLKQPDNTGNNLFRFRAMGRDTKMEFRFPRQQLQPKVYKSCTAENSLSGEKECQWEASFDFQQVLPGESVDLLIENLRSGTAVQHNEESTVVPFPTRADMAEMTVWVLMPAGKEYRSFRILRKSQGKVEEVKVASEYLAEDSTILAFRLLSVKANYVYELQWFYK